RVSRDMLANETFLMRESGSGTRMLADSFLAEIGATPKVGMEIGSNETIKQAVMAGLGVALISVNTIAAELLDKRIAILPVEGTPIRRQWYVVKRQERRLMPAAERLWSFFVGQGREILTELAQLPRLGFGTPPDEE